MSGFTGVALVVLLVAVLLLVVAALVWQEGRRRSGREPLTYVIEDAVRFVDSKLGEDTTLRKSDVRRILEWEVYYLQGLAQPHRRMPVETVAGGAEPAVEYVVRQIADRHGVFYPLDEVRRVLRLEAEYLWSIGAVGDPVDELPETDPEIGGEGP